jgi:leucyl/phenylalanyl-tRNA--protein transferase
VRRPTQGPYLLGEGLDFPPVHLADEHGLLAIGGDLSVERLLAAYRKGIFPWPWYEGMPMFWWAPDPRFVLYPDELHVGRSLRSRIRNAGYEIRYDTAFEPERFLAVEVVFQCHARSGHRVPCAPHSRRGW